jgi:hypothetical protein
LISSGSHPFGRDFAAAVDGLLAGPPPDLEVPGGPSVPAGATRLGDLHEIDRESAVQLLARWLHRDLAYGVECLPFDEAAGHARLIIGVLGDPARLWMNSTYTGREQNVWSFRPLTSATLDAGILGASEDRFLYVVVADED